MGSEEKKKKKIKRERGSETWKERERDKEQ